MLLFFLLKLTIITANLSCPPPTLVLPLFASPTIISRIVVVAVAAPLSLHYLQAPTDSPQSWTLKAMKMRKNDVKFSEVK